MASEVPAYLAYNQAVSARTQEDILVELPGMVSENDRMRPVSLHLKSEVPWCRPIKARLSSLPWGCDGEGSRCG